MSKFIVDCDKIIFLGDSKPFCIAAKEIGISTKEFSSLYRKLGGSRKGSIKRRPVPTKLELKETLKTRTHKQAAFDYSVSYKTLVRWMKKYDLFIFVYTTEMISLSDAARELKVSRMTLSNWYRKGSIVGAIKVNETRVMIPKTIMVNLASRLNKT